MENRPVPEVDIMLYAGKWYSLLSIPRFFNKHWRHTIETYVIHPDGYYAVFATYKVVNEEEIKYFRSKLSAVRGSKNTQFKLQTFWPFKDDYWVIELAEDYSYAVVGHPELKTLNIMSRRPDLPEDLLASIILRCRKKGYDTSMLVSQEHHPAAKELIH
jgi:apolipoprotein D and lipocalin family protein